MADEQSMADGLPKASKPVLILGESHGDSRGVAAVPGFARSLVRTVLTKFASQRKARLMLTARALYPTLQIIEEKSMPQNMRVLQNIEFDAAVTNDMCIERGLRVFQSGWKHGLIKVLDPTGRDIPPDQAKTIGASCGETVQTAMTYFSNVALERLFSNDPNTLNRVLGTVTTPDDLPKMRLLSQFEEVSLGEMMNALGSTAGSVLAKVEPERMYSLAMLTPIQIRALKQALGNQFPQICDWEARKIRAIAKYLESVEQITDLGENLLHMDSAEAIMIVGQWKKRDITDRANEARQRKGLEIAKGAVYDTDINFGKKFLGSLFDFLIGQPADILQGVGKLVANIQAADKADRSRRADEVRMFATRFLSYMNTDIVRALGIAGEKPTSFGEAVHILDGLFSKPGIGRKFFDGPLQTTEGVMALHKLKNHIEIMKRDGAIKSESEISVLISNSDLLDEAISPFINFK